MTTIKPDNITWHHGAVTRTNRENLLGQTSMVIWFTGLSGSGKSTVAAALEKELHLRKKLTYLLDGDNIRHGLNNNLSFSPADRSENIRRIGEVAKLMVDAGLIVLSAFISPYRADRQQIKELLPPDKFVEVYVKCPVSVCEERDVKGLYQKARSGQINNFTGISAPYEEPEQPQIVLDTALEDVATSVSKVLTWLEARGYL